MMNQCVPSSLDNMSSVEQLVKLYLKIGLSHKDVLALLAHKHSIVSSRTLKRRQKGKKKAHKLDITDPEDPKRSGTGWKVAKTEALH